MAQGAERVRQAHLRMALGHPARRCARLEVAALFYSALHRANCEFARMTGRVPRCHAERNRRARRELPGVFDDYRDLYTGSIRARCCDGFRATDGRRKSACERSCGIEKAVPF